MLRRFNVWIVLWCAFAVEERPEGLRECPPAGLAPHGHLYGSYRSFYVGAHSGSSRNRDNWGWNKIRQPCQISSLNI